MKNRLIKYYIAAIYLCTSFAMFAQDPGTGTNDGGSIDNDGSLDSTPGAPIDEYLWVLALVGLFYVYLKFRAFQKSLNHN